MLCRVNFSVSLLGAKDQSLSALSNASRWLGRYGSRCCRPCHSPVPPLRSPATRTAAGRASGSGGAGVCAQGAADRAAAGLDQLEDGTGLPSGVGVGRSAPRWCCPGAVGMGWRPGSQPNTHPLSESGQGSPERIGPICQGQPPQPVGRQGTHPPPTLVVLHRFFDARPAQHSRAKTGHIDDLV